MLAFEAIRSDEIDFCVGFWEHLPAAKLVCSLRVTLGRSPSVHLSVHRLLVIAMIDQYPNTVCTPLTPISLFAADIDVGPDADSDEILSE